MNSVCLNEATRRARAEKMANMIRIGGVSSASGAGRSLQGKSSTNIGGTNVTNKEIVQALRYCSDPDFKDCSGCKCFRYGDCLERLVADAAELIERLTAENAALREKPQWQPVLAGNPERKGCYLVAVHHWFDGKPVVREAFWNGADWLSCERRHEITPRVTHWMPLPEAPGG